MAYIDGFNLYYGLRARGWRRYYWLDPYRLSEHLLKPGQILVGVRYFTARIRALPQDLDKPRRQSTYLEALGTLNDLHIHEGYYILKQQKCPVCGGVISVPEEKMTDVSIAVELLGDAQDEIFDTAIIVSADGDLVSPVRAVRKRHPAKRIIVAFPPARKGEALGREATATVFIGRTALARSQLPDPVIRDDGYALERPPSWS